MKRYLLDTNIALLALAAPERLSRPVRKAIESGPNLLSVIVYWEVMLKAAKGKLVEVGDPRSWWATALSDLAATMLPLRAEHIAALVELPPIHHDPFDRILIAQATVEELIMLTTDEVVPAYQGSRLRVVR